MSLKYCTGLPIFLALEKNLVRLQPGHAGPPTVGTSETDVHGYERGDLSESLVCDRLAGS